MIRLLVTLLLAVAVVAPGLSASPLEEVRAKVRADYMGAAPTADATLLMATLDGNGMWADVDYTDTSGSLWQLEKHLDRLVVLALAFANSPSEGMKEAALRGLNQWFDGHYRNANWWYGKIGVPRRMLALAYLLDDALPDTLRLKVSESLSAIDSEDFPARPGGDRIQVLGNHAKVLLWRRDFKGVEDIFKKIEEEARVAPYEETMYDAGGGLAPRNSWRPSGRGVQADMSFHHRGDRVDSTLTYGLSLPETFIYWASLLKDTQWAFSPQSINFIIDYYLDGVCRHLVAGRYAEPSILNRELSRPCAGVMSPALARRLLENCGGYRADQLRQSLDIINGVRDFDDSYAANFMESGYFALARPSFQTAVRYHSRRNANQEWPHNREGIRNHFRGDGACMLSVSGREYADIAPIFDFRLIPGATTPMLPYEPLEGWGEVQVLNPPVEFAGAVADSIYGAVAFSFISPRVDLKARKGYFFFDDEYLCLGSGISSSAPYEIVTTVEQCLSPSAQMTETDGWFFHGGNAYHILQGEGTGEICRRKGTWRNCVENVEHADLEKEGDVFTLTINHGVGPADGGYAYAVCPGANGMRDHSFEILANGSSCQAVATTDGRLLYVIFYEPSSISTPYGEYASLEPCILMVRDGKETKYTYHE